MRIVHIGHGRLPIPPTQWGAVEAIISDYQFWCERYGHEFFVVNSPSPSEAINLARALNPEVAHLHDETKVDEFANLDCPVKIVTTHDPTFFERSNPFIERFCKGDFFIGCLSNAQWSEFAMRVVPPERMLLLPNGARSDLIRFTEHPTKPDRMICLGMIGQRKRQAALMPFMFVDCVGPLAAYDPIGTGGYVFESWTKNQVYANLTDYAALVLLSKYEAAPLVVMEALMAGLDVVVSEAASANLDRTQPFVTVLDERTITNPFALRVKLEGILKRTKDRRAVRNYAEQHFDWSELTKRYLSTLWSISRASYPKNPGAPTEIRGPGLPSLQPTIYQSRCPQ